MRFAALLTLFCIHGLLHAQPAVGPAAASRRLTWEDFAGIKQIRDISLSPDGQTIACILAQVDVQANRTPSELWLLPFDAGDGRRLKLEADAVEKVLWSPTGKELAVVGSLRTEQRSETYLWVLNLEGGQRKTRLDRSNHYLAHQGANLCWAPDGSALAFLAAEPDTQPPPREPIVVERIQYKTRTGLTDNRRTHVWIFEPGKGTTRQLTHGRHDEHSIDWSPGGEEIVFCSNREADPDANLNYDLFAVRVADGAVRRLTQTPGCETAPVFSPDGKRLAYTMTARALTTIDSVAEDDHVWVLDLATGKSQDLTAALDRRCSHVRWAGQDVAFLARDRGKALVYRARMDAAQGEVAAQFDLKAAVSTYSLARGGRGVCVLTQPTQPPEIYTFDNERGEPRRRTHFNAKLAAAWKLPEPREVQFKSFDGLPIHGWLLLPETSNQARTPLLLSIHGGPHHWFSYQFYPTLQLLASNGYAVLFLNPRGSIGYGQKFSDGCVNDWGGGDYKDLMAGVDHVLAAYPQLDGDRLGVFGSSYGGYMTNWVITQTPRFRAAVPYAGLSNLISFYATSLYQDLIHVEFQGKPWQRDALLWERSPLKHAARVKTPTLLLHGESDNDVHITQSEEMFTALRQLGVEAVLVRYPREGHGAGEPRFQRDQFLRTLAWFNRHLR